MKFYYAIVLLSKALYGHEDNPFEAMFAQMLVDSVLTNDNRCKFYQSFNSQVVGGRVPKMDEDTLELLSEGALRVYINYLDQLKHLFTSFVHPNFNANKKVKKMTV